MTTWEKIRDAAACVAFGLALVLAWLVIGDAVLRILGR